MGGRPRTTRTTRTRRTAEEARSAILDAAEAQLAEHGPDALRLVQVADEVGISHPAILHHFGSREGLVRAVVDRTARRIEDRIFATLSAPIDERSAVALLEGLWRSLTEEGHARQLVWLFLTRGDEGQAAGDTLGYGARLRHVAGAIEAIRTARGTGGDPEDTLFTVLLTGLALFGNAIAGEQLRRNAGLGDDPGANQRFLTWLARLLHEHLDRPPGQVSPAPAAGAVPAPPPAPGQNPR